MKVAAATLYLVAQAEVCGNARVGLSEEHVVAERGRVNIMGFQLEVSGEAFNEPQIESIVVAGRCVLYDGYLVDADARERRVGARAVKGSDGVDVVHSHHLQRA
jgi:hypothetical protein